MSTTITYPPIDSLLPKASQKERVEPRDTIDEFVPMLFGLYLSSQADVRAAATSFVESRLIQPPAAEFFSAVEASIPSLTEALKSPDPDCQSAATSTLVRLAEHKELHDGVRAAIPALIEAVKTLDVSNKYDILVAFRQLAGYDRDIFFVEYLRSKDTKLINGATAVLAELANKPAIEITIRPLIELLNHEDPEVRRGSISTLVTLIERVERREAILLVIPLLIERLKDKDSQVRAAAASIFRSISAPIPEYLDFVRVAISSLSGLLQDQDPTVRSGALLAISSLADSTEFQDAIRALIPPIIQHFQEQDIGILWGAIGAIDVLIERPEFRETIRMEVPSIVQLLHMEYAVYTAGDLVAKAAQCAELQGTIQAAVSALFECPTDLISQSLQAMVKLAEYVELRDAVKTRVPSVIQWLKTGDNESISLDEVISAVAKLTEYDELRTAFRDAIPPLLQLLKNQNWRTRGFAISAIVNLTEDSDIRKAIGEVMPGVMEALLSPYETTEPTSTDSDTMIIAFSEISTHCESYFAQRGDAADADAKRIFMTPSGLPFHLFFLRFSLIPELLPDILPSVSSLIGLLNTDTSWHGDLVAESLAKFSANIKFKLYFAIKSFISSLIQTLGSPDAKPAGVYALAAFAEYPEIRREIWEAIPTFVSLVSRVISQSKSLRLQDESGGLQTIDEALQIMKRSLPDTLIKLAKHEELRGQLIPSIRPFGELLNDGDYYVVRSTVSAPSNLAGYAEYRVAICHHIPSLMIQSTNNPGALDLEKLIEHESEFREPIIRAIPLLLKQLSETDMDVSATLGMLNSLADHGSFRKVMRPVIPQLIKLLTGDPDSSTPGEAASLLSKLDNELGDFKREIRAALRATRARVVQPLLVQGNEPRTEEEWLDVIRHLKISMGIYEYKPIDMSALKS